MLARKLDKATLTKGELMRYLGVGEVKLNKLLMNPNFPRQKPILERWSKVEVDRWLNIPFEGHFYCQATATFTNGEFEISKKAQAREEETKKGMDGSQITGSATFYARKYALAGLFGIDNEKDADADFAIKTKSFSLPTDEVTTESGTVPKTLKKKLEAGLFTIVKDGGAFPQVEIENRKFQIYDTKYGFAFATDRYFVNFKQIDKQSIKEATLKEKTK